MCGDFLQEPSYASYRNNEIERRERAAIKACYVYVSTEGARWNYKLQILLLHHHPSGVSHAVILAEYIYLADYGVVVNDV